MKNHFMMAMFQPHQGTLFSVSGGQGEPVSMTLIEVSDKTPSGFPGEQFSLIFQGPSEPALEQRIYKMEHGSLGSLELFLVPVDRRKADRVYEAFFNRSKIENDGDSA